MIKIATFDIETVPNQSLPKDLIPQFDHDTVKLGNIKDQAKIDEKIEKARQEFEQGLDKKMSLDPDLCEVVCFMGSLNDGGKPFYCGYEEKSNIIKLSWTVIKDAYLAHIPLVSFNGIQFDLPVLWHSAMKLNIPVSPQMYEDLTRKPRNFVYHYDLMQILAGWDRQKYKKLDFYLKLFGIGEKIGDGSEIYGWWYKGEYEKIREHCQQDVELTGKLFERLEPWIVKEKDDFNFNGR